MVPVEELLPADLPPILVHRATMRVIDGMHRLRAATLRGDREIAVRFFDGDAGSAFVRAVVANVYNGLPLSRSDRAAAAARIVATHPHWSDRAVATATGLAPATVAAVRRRATDQTERSNGGGDSRLPAGGRVAGRPHHPRLPQEPDRRRPDERAEAVPAAGRPPSESRAEVFGERFLDKRGKSVPARTYNGPQVRHLDGLACLVDDDGKVRILEGNATNRCPDVRDVDGWPSTPTSCTT
jgi:hypothetical protein